MTKTAAPVMVTTVIGSRMNTLSASMAPSRGLLCAALIVSCVGTGNKCHIRRGQHNGQKIGNQRFVQAAHYAIFILVLPER